MAVLVRRLGLLPADYGRLGLISIAWHDELVRSEEFLTMPTGPPDGDLLEENAEEENRGEGRGPVEVP